MNTSIYNNTFLNSLFTAEEFNFMKYLDSDTKEFDEILEKEILYRDTIVKFISNLKETLLSDSSISSKHNFSSLLNESQECFELANTNIKSTGTIKKYSEDVTQIIIDLLIRIDSEGNNISELKYNDEISQIKTKLNSFSKKYNDYKSELASNDIKIKDFLNKDIVKKYVPTTKSEGKESPRMDTAYTYISVNKEKYDIPQDMKEDNDTLLISEKEGKVYLPYSKKEVVEYMEQYPNQYNSFVDVVRQEFVFPIDMYVKHPAIARFRETYSLIRDRESKSIVEAFKLAMDNMFKYELNPAIIAACKSQDQLENYLECLVKNKTDEFGDFKIQFEITPFKS